MAAPIQPLLGADRERRATGDLDTRVRDHEHMPSAAAAVRQILSSISEASRGPLSEVVRRYPGAQAGLQLRPIADSTDLEAVASVQARQPDGGEVCWSVSVRISDAEFRVSGQIEVGDAAG